MKYVITVESGDCENRGARVLTAAGCSQIMGLADNLVRYVLGRRVLIISPPMPRMSTSAAILAAMLIDRVEIAALRRIEAQRFADIEQCLAEVREQQWFASCAPGDKLRLPMVDVMIFVADRLRVHDFLCRLADEEGVRYPSLGGCRGGAWIFDCDARTLTYVVPGRE